MDSQKLKLINVVNRPRDSVILKRCGLSAAEYEIHEIPLVSKESNFHGEEGVYDEHIGGNLCEYVHKAVEYVKQHGISHLFFTTDIASIVGAAICERTGLPGPTVESQFLCLHKYYTRKAEPSKLRFDYIDLNSGDAWKDKVWYPCYVKAPFLCGSMCHFVIHNEAEMEDALEKAREWLRPWFDLLNPFFQQYVNLEKYPLANAEVLIMEEFVRDFDTMLCVEGWVTADKHYHVFAINEYTRYSNPASFNFTTLPSNIPPQVKAEAQEYALQIVQKFDLSNQVFNVELWKRGSRLDVTEVNARIYSGVEVVYNMAYGVSLYKTAVHVACGEVEKALEESPGQEKCIAGQFSINVRGEGRLGDMIDYQRARSLGETEDVYNAVGERGIAMYLDDNFIVGKEERFQVGFFNVTAQSHDQLMKKGDAILSQLYKHPDYRPIP